MTITLAALCVALHPPELGAFDADDLYLALCALLPFVGLWLSGARCAREIRRARRAVEEHVVESSIQRRAVERLALAVARATKIAPIR